MKIGDVKLQNNIFLAPMAGVTDLPYRVICKEQGCGLVYSEMISAKALLYGDKKTERLLKMSDIERPVAVQIFGSEPETIAFAAAQAEKAGAAIVDINMGCPVPKVAGNGDGCALMLKPTLVGELVRAAVGAVSIPVTVKIRKGWDEDNINAVDIALIAQEGGAAAVAVHGRTRNQMYSGKADWNIIKAVKKELNIPVIGNGDIFKASDAKDMLEYTGCDAVMIARGALGNPWIFAQALEYIQTNEVITLPSLRQRLSMAIRHAQSLVDEKGEYVGIREARSHISWYLKGIKGGARVRDLINHANSLLEVKEILQQLNTEE